MNALGRRIAQLIAADGPLSVAQFMNICLNDPEGGTYAVRQPIARDFITAPEISQMFGELCGLWAAQVWLDQGRPERPRLVELGPGRGTLMADALRAIAAAVPEFLKDAEIVLVENSPLLKGMQREKLKDYTVSWQERFDARLSSRPLLLLANEFFDCLPVRQYVRTERGWCERMVVAREEGLAFALAPVPVDPVFIPSDRHEAPEGGVYETAPAALALAEEIARLVERHGGGALIVDYGYDAPGFGETLQAIAGGDFTDVLEEPGENDLSAHVDFPALGEAARQGGAAVFGPVTQGRFLSEMGIGPRAARLKRANPAQAAEITAAAERLVHPGKMGTLFKALAMVPKNTPQPPGF